MSFFISINGQFRPYTPSNFISSNEVKAISSKFPIDSIVSHDEISKTKLNDTTKHTLHEAFLKNQKKKQLNQKSIFAKDLMSAPVYYHYDNDSFSKVFESFKHYQYKHFPILNTQQILVGIVSDRDLLKTFDHNLLVKDFMSKEVLTVRSNARIQEIAMVMLNEQLSALPVISDKNTIIGIITKSDLLNFIIKNYNLDFYT